MQPLTLTLAIAAVAAVPLAAHNASAEFLAYACAAGDTARCIEYHAEQCDKGRRHSCERLAHHTQGQCASPKGLGGCRFNSLVKL